MKNKSNNPWKSEIADMGRKWNTDGLHQCNHNPFDLEYLKYYNEREGRDQILFLYKDKITKEIIKYRILA